jgi:hypothetical protein
MNKADFFKMLESMDWYYHYSDDMRVWDAGRNAESRIKKIASKDPILASMYNDYVNYIFNNGIKPEVSNYENKDK